MKARVLVLAMLFALLVPAPGRADMTLTRSGVTAQLNQSTVQLNNGIVSRTWQGDHLVTTSVGRIGSEFTTPHDDFHIWLDGVEIPSGVLPVSSVSVMQDVPNGLGIRWKLGVPGAVEVERTVEAFYGIAGFKTQTIVKSAVPVALSGYTLDEIAFGWSDKTTINAFRAGSDWREPGWNPPSLGDAHTGDWRDTRTAGNGATLSGPGEWLSVEGNGKNAGIVAERRDFPSSRVTYTGGASGVARADVDLSRDIIDLGPFEETGHIENPGPGPARHRVVTTLALEPAFTIFAKNADDEAWQFYKYLTQHRLGSYPKRVMFNSDGVDLNQHSTGAKDDMTFQRFQDILPAVREMGADTFIFDDGWMARSGDWCPDSPPCLEPRNSADPVKFAPRFPDDHFEAVNAELGDMDLGLWMNPMEFNPQAKAFQMNPQWACAPVGDALALYNLAQPDSSSNEAGLGVWNPLALGIDPDTGQPTRMIDYLEGRINRAIEVYGSKYFKFDFLAWVDCGGAYPVTMYEYHDAFVDMLDRIQAIHRDVTFSIDETNDYRMFPYESTARGPAWFLNGGPSNADLLHAVWNLSPYIPGYSLGMRSLSSVNTNTSLQAIDMMMASSLLGHMTFSFPVDTRMTTLQRAEVRKWVDFYHANSESLASMTYPLGDDPTHNTWTALQSWNGDDQAGWVIAYKLGGSDSAHDFRLKDLQGLEDATFHVVQLDPVTNLSTDLGTVTGAQLQAGLNVQIAQPNGYAIYRITRVS